MKINQLLKVHESGLSNWDLRFLKKFCSTLLKYNFSHLVEKDKKYYEDLEKAEEEKKRKRDEIKKDRENKK